MEIMNKVEGKLKVMVSSEDNVIYEGTPVVIETVADNFKNIFVRVISMKTEVKLPYFDTDIDWLLVNNY